MNHGIGPVIKAALYKPISEKDKVKIEKILKSAQRFFYVISYIFIVYLVIFDHDETYNGFLSYNGVVYPQISYVQEGVYCLEEEEIAKNVINQYKGEFYGDIWREVVDHYGDVDLNGRNSVSQKYE